MTFWDDINDLFDVNNKDNKVGPILLVCLVALTLVGVGMMLAML